MSELSTCKTCPSADTMLSEFITDLGVDTSHHRVETQKSKCRFGLQGICCKLCANGPCKITPSSPKGVCGATADTIVARNFLRAVSAGSGCYIHIVENAARNLKLYAAKGKLKSVETLHKLADIFGIKGRDEKALANLVADKVLADLYKPSFEQMELVEKLATAPRFKKWQELKILPGGAKSEVFDGVVKTSTNLNSDPLNMLLHCLRLGISTGLYGLTLTNLLNDVILGAPVLRTAPVGLRVIDSGFINIMLTGHQHSMFSYLQDRLIEEEITNRAKAVGAKGFRLIGCTCVGQDLQLRGEHCSEVFSGHAGNNFTSEAVIATGAIDMIVSEFNCTLPGIEPIANEFMVSMICIDDVAKKSNADHNAYSFEEDNTELMEHIITKALKSYEERRPSVAIKELKNHGDEDVLTGVSEGSLREFLGGDWKPLIDLLASGKIKGIAGIVGCSNLTAKGHDVFTVELAKELIKRDILILSAGCSSGGLENVGLMSAKAASLAGDSLRAVCESLGIPPVLNFGPCLAIGRLELVASELAETLGIDIPQLPLVLSAPQWLEEQALADGSFGLALGLPLHLALPPFTTGSEVVTKVLTEDMISLTGGQLIIEDDVLKTADLLEGIIEDKRNALGL
ncbi:carbon-monoxide dehydrogenase catalytic subunit [Anaerocolumna cellulosilytica]|uniref:Carbon monoxide dehydrogenase n=1 Tax=Anaerocolumna cellulosilytica TaxID=433286 RepID=A0A6S6R2G0_9FIRM|nr:anaerobic carbon-monoxide dehydrogenase catalytic subunit [Anaerocolumna cellulosilytica]MBB5197645.1 carbon-monoxide dehydrogenase catalytic subunit [Anaerocolumna cellulosilytica]BCJ93218.1 carbon-monoxide dehydrogenase catalytic subunit [Anaerocolumna cellulosilytica]